MLSLYLYVCPSVIPFSFVTLGLTLEDFYRLGVDYLRVVLSVASAFPSQSL